MSSREITGVGSQNSPPKTENYPPKLRTLGFAVIIIFGIGGLLSASVGIGGLLQAGSLWNLGQIKSIIMIAIGGSGGLTLLIIGVVGSVKTHFSSKAEVVVLRKQAGQKDEQAKEVQEIEATQHQKKPDIETINWRDASPGIRAQVKNMWPKRVAKFEGGVAEGDRMICITEGNKLIGCVALENTVLSNPTSL